MKHETKLKIAAAFAVLFVVVELVVLAGLWIKHKHRPTVIAASESVNTETGFLTTNVTYGQDMFRIHTGKDKSSYIECRIANHVELESCAQIVSSASPFEHTLINRSGDITGLACQTNPADVVNFEIYTGSYVLNRPKKYWISCQALGWVLDNKEREEKYKSDIGTGTYELNFYPLAMDCYSLHKEAGKPTTVEVTCSDIGELVHIYPSQPVNSCTDCTNMLTSDPKSILIADCYSGQAVTLGDESPCVKLREQLRKDAEQSTVRP